MSAANALSTESSSSAPAETRSAEPSMEDILASIRRIIADDQSRGLTGSAPLRRGVALNVTAPASADHLAAPPPADAVASTARGPSALFGEPLASTMPAPAVAATAPSAFDPIARAARPPGGYALRLGVGRASEPAVPHLNPPPPAVQTGAPPEPADTIAVISAIAHAGAASILAPHVAIDPEPQPAAAVALDLRPAVLAADQRPAVKEPPPAFIIETVEIPLNDDAPAPFAAALEAKPDLAPEPDLTPVPEAVAEPDDDVLVLAGYEAAPAEGGDADGADETLLADHVGASVESSFQALASSVFMRNTGAVDAMLRDMLRPLLKTWLDDNLPTIVERLVRVEIERVARGSRT